MKFYLALIISVAALPRFPEGVANDIGNDIQHLSTSAHSVADVEQDIVVPAVASAQANTALGHRVPMFRDERDLNLDKLETFQKLYFEQEEEFQLRYFELRDRTIIDPEFKSFVDNILSKENVARWNRRANSLELMQQLEQIYLARKEIFRVFDSKKPVAEHQPFIIFQNDQDLNPDNLETFQKLCNEQEEEFKLRITELAQRVTEIGQRITGPHDKEFLYLVEIMNPSPSSLDQFASDLKKKQLLERQYMARDNLLKELPPKK